MRPDHRASGVMLLLDGLLGIVLLFLGLSMLHSTTALLESSGVLGFFALMAILGFLLFSGRLRFHEVVEEVPETFELKMAVLRRLAMGEDQAEIARMERVSEAKIARSLEALEQEGCITENNLITQKGYEKLGWKPELVST